MKISVVTICFNSEATIASTVESFLEQTYPYKELLIIDGASQDHTIEIVRGFGRKDINIISEPDQGIYDAMNKGLANYSGDAIGFLNSDDTYHDNQALNRVADALANADIAYGDLQMVTDHASKHVVRMWRSGRFGRYSYQLGWMPPHPTFYTRRAVTDQVGDYDLSYGIASDYDYMLRAMVLNDFRVRQIPHILVDFQVGGESTRDWRASLQINLECRRARQRHLKAPWIDAALFLRPARRLFQLRQIRRYFFRSA